MLVMQKAIIRGKASKKGQPKKVTSQVNSNQKTKRKLSLILRKQKKSN